MFISIDLLIKIALIALTVIHIIFDIWVLVKLKGIKGGTAGAGLSMGTVFENVKKVASSFLNYIEPKFPNVIGLIKLVTGGDKQDQESKNNG